MREACTALQRQLSRPRGVARDSVSAGGDSPLQMKSLSPPRTSPDVLREAPLLSRVGGGSGVPSPSAWDLHQSQALKESPRTMLILTWFPKRIPPQALIKAPGPLSDSPKKSAHLPPLQASPQALPQKRIPAPVSPGPNVLPLPKGCGPMGPHGPPRTSSDHPPPAWTSNPNSAPPLPWHRDVADAFPCPGRVQRAWWPWSGFECPASAVRRLSL